MQESLDNKIIDSLIQFLMTKELVQKEQKSKHQTGTSAKIYQHILEK